MCKDFDYCSTCEERLGHEHPFLKIKVAGGAPDVMVTMLGEEASPGHRGRGGRGGMRGNHGMRGRGGRGGCGGFGGRGGMGGMGPCGDRVPGMKKMFKQLFGEADIDCDFMNGPNKNKDPKDFMSNIFDAFTKFQESGKLEEMKKKFQNGEFKWESGQNQWRAVRASVVSKPDQVLEAYSGQMLLPEIQIKNATYWPWKEGCYLSFDDSQDLVGFPIEMLKAPIDFEVKGQTTFKLNVPIKVLDSAIAEDKEHELKLTFRGPNGNSFGEMIVIKLRVIVSPRVSDEEFFRLALKLTELNLGSFDQCV